MFEPKHLDSIRAAIERQTSTDAALLQRLREDVRERLGPVQVIRPRAASAVSLVASDGGSNRLGFDPFSLELVRVMDSNGDQLLLDAISPSTDPDELLARHHERGDALHVLLEDLCVEHLHELSPVFPRSSAVREQPDRVPQGWPKAYRDLAEWAVLYERVSRRQWGSDTLLVRDGLLRSAIFRGDILERLGGLLKSAIEHHRERGVQLFLVGVAKRSQVLTRYRLAMALEDTLPAGAPRYVEVPRELERKTYRWAEYAQGVEEERAPGSLGLALGAMFLVRFGKSSHDPVWPVDVLAFQAEQAKTIFGYLQADALVGFPVPWYPRCLQRAHEHAQLVDFDVELLQAAVLEGTRTLVEEERREIIDGLALASDVASRRYR
jgi:hypothetical protein